MINTLSRILAVVDRKLNLTRAAKIVNLMERHLKHT